MNQYPKDCPGGHADDFPGGLDGKRLLYITLALTYPQKTLNRRIDFLTKEERNKINILYRHIY